ncbi:MAG TPA: hypothetical protein VKE25_07660 [Actinomycetes bacterium]|nr:hypothetical protein [Actinomycetes bacterium]
MASSEPVLTVDEAIRRIETDRGLLMQEVDLHSAEALVAPYRMASGPLGDFCESLRDLVGHVLMWDEINLAVLTEAGLGRAHWSLDPYWETPEAGRQLNRFGVIAAGQLPVDLLLHRFAVVRDALLAELRGQTGQRWDTDIRLDLDPPRSVGALTQYVMTVPGTAPYWHAAIHLRRLADVGSA